MSDFDNILQSLVDTNTAMAAQMQTAQTPTQEGGEEWAEKTLKVESFVSKSPVTPVIDTAKVLNPVQNYDIVMPNFENILLKSFLERPEFFNRAKTIIKKEIFSNFACSSIYDIISKYYDTYKRIPKVTEIYLEVEKLPNAELRKSLDAKIREFSNSELIPRDYMDDYTVRYVKDQLFERALMIGAEFIDKKKESSKLKAKELIDLSQKVELNAELGDTFDNYAPRLDYYLNPEKGLLYSDFETFNNYLGEGILNGTLNIFLAPPGIGKSMMMSFTLCDFLKQKKNVLLVSMEMSNYEFLKRIDANLLGIPIRDLSSKEREADIISGYTRLKGQLGNLYVQNYTPGSFSAYSLEALLDMYASNNIHIDVVFLDYLGLMKSDKLEPQVGLYSYLKSIGEEVRGVAKQHNICIFSASQLNRQVFGKDAREVDNSTISDSLGTAMTADLLVMMLQTEAQKEKCEITFKITKNRYTGLTLSLIHI